MATATPGGVPEPRESGKGRAARIPLNYYKRPDRLQRGKLLLAVGAVPLAVGWWLWGVWKPARHYSPGPLAAVHATWDDRCAACHVAFAALRDDAWAAPAGHGADLDQQCQICHPGPEHHATQKKEEVAGCVGCHRDHRGRDASLVRVADEACTRCHDELTRHTTKPAQISAEGPSAAGRVTKFDEVHHPQFLSAASDPGKLKFSHRRHLALGLNRGAQDRFKPLKVGDLPPQDRDRYRPSGGLEDALIQLDCASCHQLNSGDGSTLAGKALPGMPLSAPSGGMYMIPISYERHCRACHPLTFDPDLPEGTAHRLIPHGLTPPQIKEFLDDRYARLYFEGKPELFDQSHSVSRLPQEPAMPQRKEVRDFIEQKATGVQSYLRGRCTKCHEMPGLPSQTSVERTQVPQIWLKHARFDHTAHRALSCRQCHPKAYLYENWLKEEQPSPLDNSEVLIPQLDDCVQCHAPARGNATGGARFDCVECHRYHGGDAPQSGRGAKTRDAAADLLLREFLEGREPRRTPTGTSTADGP